MVNNMAYLPLLPVIYTGSKIIIWIITYNHVGNILKIFLNTKN